MESVKQTIPECRFCKATCDAQSVKGEFVYGGEEHQHFWQCNECQMIYLFPPFSEDEEEKFYRSEFEKYMSDRAGTDMDWTGPEKHFQSNQREVKRRMPFLVPYLDNVETVLELGCSSGFMLSALKAQGKDVYGIDPSGVFKDYVRSKDITVFDDIASIQKSHPTLKFDLIIHYFVLEHIRYPVEFIKEYMELLSDKGKMIFEIPNASDPLVELYKVPAFDKFYWSVVHHWYYNRQSMQKVLEKTGCSYQLFPEQRYDLSNHITWMLEGKPGGLGKYSDVFGDELDKAYKQRLIDNWLCDTIVAVVNKK